MITKSAAEMMRDVIDQLAKEGSGELSSFAFDSEGTYQSFLNRLGSGLSEMARTASAAQPFAARFLTQEAKPFALKNVSDVDHVAAGGITTTATLCYPEGTDPADTD